MAAIVFQTNKKTGLTYAYESISYWDKEKQQSRAKRRCIGRVDPETKQIIATRQSKKAQQPMTVNSHVAKRSFYGATYLFDSIGQQIGLVNDLKKCFPNIFKQILSLAYFLILEDKNPLSRFPRWAAIHKHPCAQNISSQRSSELFSAIDEDGRMQFFRLQGKRRSENEYWAYDTTSISSYSKLLKQVRYGFNKDDEPLPQINLALLFGEQSNLPFYYRKLAGNIPDVKTINNLIADMDFLDCSKIKLVMDKGFYSEANVNDLYKNHLKFILPARRSLRFVKPEIDSVTETIRSWENYHQDYDLYAISKTINWNYSQARPYKNDTISEKRRMYLHIYYSGERALIDEKSFHSLLCTLHKELEDGQRNPAHEKQYAKYFDIKQTPLRGLNISAKQAVIDDAKKHYGYFALLSNEVKDPIKALEIYRNKDLVEKSFADLKGRLSFNRTSVSSETSLDGKLFVEFIALIYLSYVKKKMQDNKLFGKYTMQELFDELDLIESFEYPGKDIRCSEMTGRQLSIFEAMGVKPPTSLHASGI